MPEVQVLVVARDPLVRGGLASMLGSQTGIRVAAQASPDDDLPQYVSAYRADVLLWDLGAESQSGVTRLVEAASGLPPVLALVESAASAGQTWSAGVGGILLREASPQQIAAALVALAEGAVVLDPDVASSLARRGPAAPQSLEALTPRELDVLRLLAEGLPNKAIAARLDLSENTVKFHINAIFGKLGVQSRTEAVTRATRMGLIPL